MVMVIEECPIGVFSHFGEKPCLMHQLEKDTVANRDELPPQKHAGARLRLSRPKTHHHPHVLPGPFELPRPTTRTMATSGGKPPRSSSAGASMPDRDIPVIWRTPSSAHQSLPTPFAVAMPQTPETPPVFRLVLADRKILQYQYLGVAGGLGFEPRLAESESAVLPLDDPPIGIAGVSFSAPEV